MSSCESKKIIVKKKCDNSTSTYSSSLTSDCYTSPSSRKCKKDCSSSEASIEIIELSGSSSSSSSSSSSCGKGRRRDKCCRGRSPSPKHFGDSYYSINVIPQSVNNFRLLEGDSNNGLPLFVSINCRTVTIQWPGFTGQIGSSGASYLYVGQYFRGLPRTNVLSSYLINWQGGDALSVVEVNGTNQDTLRWYIQQNRKGTNVNSGNTFTVYGGSVTYISNRNC